MSAGLVSFWFIDCLMSVMARDRERWSEKEQDYTYPRSGQEGAVDDEYWDLLLLN